MFAEVPNAELTRVDVMHTQMHVQWKYDSDAGSNRSVEDGEYSVRVQIKYKKESDKEYSTYPEVGSKIPAEQVLMCKTISKTSVFEFIIIYHIIMVLYSLLHVLACPT